MKQSIALGFVSLVFFGCAPKEMPPIRSTNPFPETVFYQIYTRAFSDSDGDGIGDLNGITQKLDYLEDLGVGALWIMPVFQAPTVHKYFAADFMKVDAEYGSADDLKHLVSEAHKKNIKILIDFSINHASYQHPWFQESIGTDSGNIFRKRFHWLKDPGDYCPENHTMEGLIDSSFKVNFKKVHEDDADRESDWYYARFMDAPDFNYDNLELREYMLDVGRYWLGEIGIDGLRLDAARHIYDIESTQPVREGDRNYTWWDEFCREMNKIRPDAFLLGEIWSNTEVMGSYLGLGMDAVFNFQFSTAMQQSVREERNTGLTGFLMDMHDQYCAEQKDFGDATFLINHDMPRLMDALDFEEQKVRLAVSILLTYPGSPFIYSGEELGYRADRWLVWLPMLWNEEGRDLSQTSWMFDSTVSKTLISPPPHDALEGIEPLSIQAKDEASLFNHYRNMIRLRKGSALLTSGGLKKSDLSNESIVAFYRTAARDSLLVLHNMTSAQQAIETTSSASKFSQMFYSSDMKGGVKDGWIVLPPYSTLILRN